MPSTCNDEPLKLFTRGRTRPHKRTALQIDCAGTTRSYNELEGTPQATAPIGRKASTNVMACFGSEFRKRFVAFKPRIFFEFESFFFGIVVLF